MMNAISTRSPVATRPVLTPQTFDQLMIFAETAAGSDLVPRDYKGKPANIVIAVQMGSELGLQPMQALTSIAVVNGRPGVWGDGLIGLCRQSPLCEDIREWIEGEGDARTAFCEARRKGSASPILGKFSVADAKKAGLWSKQGPWTQYPDRMLQNRARGFSLRDAFADLLRGLKTVEELRDYPDEPRQERQVQATVVRQEPRPEPKPQAAAPTLDETLNGDNWDFDAPAPKPDGLRTDAERIKTWFAGTKTPADVEKICAHTGVQAVRAKMQAEHRDELLAELEVAENEARARIANDADPEQPT